MQHFHKLHIEKESPALDCFEISRDFFWSIRFCINRISGNAVDDLGSAIKVDAQVVDPAMVDPAMADPTMNDLVLWTTFV